MSAIVARRAADAEPTTSTPLAGGLPALYGEPQPSAGDTGTFVQRFTDALDEVLAPVLVTLDNLPAYFDPKTAPEYFLDWLAGWVGLELFEKWSPEVRRPLVADAVERHGQRGTKLGVENVVAIFADVDPEQITIEESGGVWGPAVAGLDNGRAPEFPPTAPAGTWMKITVALGEERFARDGDFELDHAGFAALRLVLRELNALQDPVVDDRRRIDLAVDARDRLRVVHPRLADAVDEVESMRQLVRRVAERVKPAHILLTAVHVVLAEAVVAP